MASEVSRHYTSGDLLARLESRLRADGFDPARPTFEALAPYDHFHGRGLEATEEMANLLEVSGTGHVLDVGSGIGGPARYVALIHGELAEEITANSGRALKELRALPMEVVGRKVA